MRFFAFFLLLVAVACSGSGQEDNMAKKQPRPTGVAGANSYGFGGWQGGTQNPAAADPTNIAGNANLALWMRADKGIQLHTAMRLESGSGGGALSLAGTLAQAIPLIAEITLGGAVTTARVAFSLDGGDTFLADVLTATSGVTVGSGITAGFAAGTYVQGTKYRVLVTSWTDQKSGFVFSQATAANMPILDGNASGGQLSLKFSGAQWLACSTALVASWVSGDDLAFSTFMAVRPTGAGLGIPLSANAPSGNGSWAAYQNAATWQVQKVDNSGGFANPTGGTIVPNTTYLVETWSTGTQQNLTANGVAALTNAAGNVATASNISVLTIGASVGGTNGFVGYVDEIAIYNANVHTVATTPMGSYLSARYVDRVSTRLSDSLYFDQIAPSTPANPATVAPNDYRIHQFSRLKVSVPSGVTALQVDANTYIDGGIGSLPVFNQVGVRKDGTRQTMLTYTSPVGLVSTQTITLDGSAHAIELEEQASIVAVRGVGGTITVATATPPNTRVSILGDSIVWGYDNTQSPFSGWASVLRYDLSSATYGTSIWGVKGITLNAYASSAPLVTSTTATLIASLDGTAKNILIISLGTNDYNGGVLASTFQTWLSNLVAALHTAMSTLKIVIFSPINRTTETANGAGSTLGDFRTACAAVVTANSGFCTYLEGNGLINVGSQTFDGLHPNDAGYLVIEAAVKTAVLAL